MTSDEPAGRRDVRSSSFVLHPLLVVLLAGALLGTFIARFWYELDPVRFAPFGDWPGVIGLAVAGAVFLGAQWWAALRRILTPDVAIAAHVPFAILLLYILWPEVNLRPAAVTLLASAGLALAIGLRGWMTSPSPPTPLPLLISSGEGEGRRPALRAARRSAVSRGVGEVALALIVFAVYVRTLGVHVGKADTFEFQVVAPTLGIAHPTGYPLYVMIGKLFSLLPIGSMAFRVNLTSAVFATGAVMMVYAITARLGGRRLVAFITALAFAVSQVVWSQAVVAEVYALNALIAGLMIALLLDLLSVSKSTSGDARSRSTSADVSYGVGGDSSRRPPASSDIPYIVGAAFLLLGLGISHHLTTILLLPAFALAILIARPRLRLRTILISLGLFVLGLSVWLYIPLRWPALHGGVPMTFDEFIGWITGSRFGGALVLSAWSDPTRWSIVTRFLLDAFSPVGAALAAIGLIGLAVRHRWAALVTFAVFAAYVLYGLVYLVPDVSVFLLPAFLILAIWIGVGVATLISFIATRIPVSLRMYALSVSAFGLLPILLGSHNFPLVDQRDAGAQAETWGRYVLGLPIREGAAILVDSEKIAPLYYLQVTENVRPDLDILVLGTEQEYRQQLDARLAQGQPVYLARYLPNLPYPLRSLGPLVEVLSQRVGESADRQGVSVKFGDLFELAAVSQEEGDPFRVTLTWRALTGSRPNYHVRLRLIDERGKVWWEDSGVHPVGGYYPTGLWAEGEVVTDYHEIAFDPAFPPGAYTLQVGLFPPFREDGLITADGSTWWSVASLVAPQVAPPPLDRAVRQTYGNRVVVYAVEPPGTLPQSSQGKVRVNWANTNPDLAPLNATVSVDTARVDTSGAERRMDTSVRQASLDFRTPDRDGTYAVRLSLLDSAGQPLPARCGWLQPLTLDCPIGAVQVAGAAIGNAINFDNQALLTGWSIDRTSLRPGEALHVTLNWRGLKTWDADYTAFVHLVGPDGRLHGQIDAWPVQGTLPTSTWAAGQTVADPYVVTLSPDAPGGRYQIEVGWYLLATLRRLPVLDAAGRAADDRVIIGEFDVP